MDNDLYAKLIRKFMYNHLFIGIFSIPVIKLGSIKAKTTVLVLPHKKSELLTSKCIIDNEVSHFSYDISVYVNKSVEVGWCVYICVCLYLCV